MIVSKEIWSAYTSKQKLEKTNECLEELYKIENKTHAMYGLPEQGRLCTIRHTLEQFILDTIDWETPKDL